MQQLTDSILDKINIIATNNFENKINNNINLLVQIIDNLERLSNYQEDDLLRQEAIFNINDENDYEHGKELFLQRILSIVHYMIADNNVEALSSANSASNLLHSLNEYMIHNQHHNNMHGGNKQEIIDSIHERLDHYKKTQLITYLINDLKMYKDKILLTQLFKLIANCLIDSSVYNDLDTIKEIYKKYESIHNTYSSIKPIAMKHYFNDEDDMDGGNGDKDEFIDKASQIFPSKEFIIQLLYRQELDPHHSCAYVFNEVLELLIDKYEDNLEYIQEKIDQCEALPDMVMRQHAIPYCAECGMDEPECTCN